MIRTSRARWFMWAWAAGFAAAASTVWAQPAIRPDQFAYGVRVETRTDAPFQEVVVPLEVYRGITRSDLEDSAVFDAAGNAVPHAFRLPGQPAPQRLTEWLPIFPVYGRSDVDRDGLSLSLKRAPDGTLLELKSDSKAKPGERIVAYVMDASALTDPYSALEVSFGPDKASQLFQVRLEVSDDLSHWTMYQKLTIGRLAHQGMALERNKLEFRPCRYKYLRLSWDSEGEELELQHARVQLSHEVTEDQHQWETLQAVPSRQGDKGYQFDTRGLIPVDRLKVLFPGANVAVPVKVFSRPTPKDPWQLRVEALVHRLNIEGTVYSGEVISLTRVMTDRLWKVEASLSPGEATSSEPVELVVGWVPHRLIFLAQGKPPYLFAFGSTTQKATPFPLQNLLDRVTPQARNKLLVAAASLGSRQQLGGPERLRPVAPPLPWKAWILWAVLLTGVALMGWMAFKLHRQLAGDRAKPGQGSEGEE